MTTLAVLVDRLRGRLADYGGDVDPLSPDWRLDDVRCRWSNIELTSYFSSAAEELAHRVPIRDSSTPEIVELALIKGVSTYSVDQRILAIDSLIRDGLDVPLYKLTDALERSRVQDSDYRSRRLNDLAPAVAYREDLDALQLTILAPPIEYSAAWMSVRRRPLRPFNWTARDTQSSEFPSHCDDALIDWACMLACQKSGVDTFDLTKAGYWQGQFTDRVGPRVNFQLRAIHRDVANDRIRTRACFY